VHLAYIWIVSHLPAKNYRICGNLTTVLTKTNLLSFFGDTVYKRIVFHSTVHWITLLSENNIPCALSVSIKCYPNPKCQATNH